MVEGVEGGGGDVGPGVFGVVPGCEDGFAREGGLVLQIGLCVSL